jgi:hypothetical protein
MSMFEDLYAVWEKAGVLGLLDSVWQSIATMSWAALLLALFVPVLLIYCRNEIRVRRLRLIADFVLSYPTTRDKRSATSSAGLEPASNPSLELVTAKYLADLGDPDYKLSRSNSMELVEEIERRIRSSRIFGNLGDYRLLAASAGFAVLCYFGFLNLFSVVTNGFEILTASGGRVCSIAAGATTCCPEGSVNSQLQIVGSLAFAGAFIAASRQFVRSLAVFDLSAYTFLWQTVEIFASVIIVIFLYEAFEDPSKAIEAIVAGGDAAARQCDEVPWIWMALAPLLGLLPQSATKFLLLKMQSLVAWVKTDDDRFNAVTRLTPLDVIDGIDYPTRFRLEECGIYDVQNLATYNPIMLHVESPYGIYQTIDWVGQAQLCNILGLDKFLLLKQMNIRTVFDLERSLDFWSIDERRWRPFEGPDEFDKIYAGVLFAATNAMRKIGEVSGIQPLVSRQPKADLPPVIEAVGIDAYCIWACEVITADPATTKRCIEHLMGWIADDLHVRRLRRIWQEMSDDLGERSKRMDTSFVLRPPAPEPAQ